MEAPEQPRYVVLAGHGPAMVVCAHYHEEHLRPTLGEARNLAADLRPAHAFVAIVETNARERIVSSFSGPVDGSCRLCADETFPPDGCAYCGDLLAAAEPWTR